MAVEMTDQERAWAGQLGQDYTDRNTMTEEELDALYMTCFGITRTMLDWRFLQDIPQTARILEVGCNIGMQLRHLQGMGFTNLHGIELQQYAIDRLCVQGVEVRQGSATELPYPDNSFDLVYTSGVLIHIPPEKLDDALSGIVRVSKRWIWGFEYYSAVRREIRDRYWVDMLWADDYPACFLWDNIQHMRLVRRWSELYHRMLPGTVADMYLLEKR